MSGVLFLDWLDEIRIGCRVVVSLMNNDQQNKLSNVISESEIGLRVEETLELVVREIPPILRENLSHWKIASIRAHRELNACKQVSDNIVTAANRTIDILCYFKEKHEEHTNVVLLHPPNVFERLEWALQCVLSQTPLPLLPPFSRGSRVYCRFSKYKSRSLYFELNAKAQLVRIETLKILLSRVNNSYQVG